MPGTSRVISPTIERICARSSGLVAEETSMQLPCPFQLRATFFGDDLPQGLAAEGQVLNLAGAGIRSAADDDASPVFVIEEGLQRVAAEVGIERDGVEAEFVKDGPSISGAGVADVGAFGVADCQDCRLSLPQVCD